MSEQNGTTQKPRARAKLKELASPIVEGLTKGEKRPAFLQRIQDHNDRHNERVRAARLATALEALTERAFKRCLFPREVKDAFAALDAYNAEIESHG